MANRNMNDRPDGLAGSIDPPFAPKIAANSLNKKIGSRLPSPVTPRKGAGKTIARQHRPASLSTRFSRP